jgi:hypothetical protein
MKVVSQVKIAADVTVQRMFHIHTVISVFAKCSVGI